MKFWVLLSLSLVWIPCISQEKKLPPWLLQSEKQVKKSGRKTPPIGEITPDFVQNDSTGTSHHLSEFKGKYVLLDFWASWCGPCRFENPNLVAAYHKFKSKNLVLISITIDDEKDRSKWLSAVKEDELQWLQLADFDQSVNKLYNITAIPTNFLIDPEGKIVAKNLRGERLNSVLEKILK